MLYHPLLPKSQLYENQSIHLPPAATEDALLRNLSLPRPAVTDDDPFTSPELENDKWASSVGKALLNASDSHNWSLNPERF